MTYNMTNVLFSGVIIRGCSRIKYISKVSTQTQPPTKDKKHSASFTLLNDQVQIAEGLAKSVMENPEISKLYHRILRKKEGVYQHAFLQFLHLPHIETVSFKYYGGVKGERIHIGVSDSCLITAAKVLIKTKTGKILERGICKKIKYGKSWSYKGRKDINDLDGIIFIFTVFDSIGNTCSLHITIEKSEE